MSARSTDEWAGLSILHTAASRVGGLDIGFVPGEGGLGARDMLRPPAKALDLLFLLGADEIDRARTAPFVVYIGTHGDAGAHRADVILPGAAYTEKSGTWVNTEGRVQLGNRAAFPPGDAREDWSILRALSGVLGKTLPFDSLGAASRQALCRRIRTWPSMDSIRRAEKADFDRLASLGGSLSGRGLRQPDPRLLSDQPDRPRLGGAGRMLGHASRPGRGSGGVGAGDEHLRQRLPDPRRHHRRRRARC